MSTRSSIWCGHEGGMMVHIYWELVERESNNGRMAGAPIYIAADSGDVNKEVAVKLPKDLAMQLLTILSPDFAEDVARVI